MSNATKREQKKEQTKDEYISRDEHPNTRVPGQPIFLSMCRGRRQG
jgi:hypothetical protein